MKKLTLSQGKFALVDDSDFEFLNQWKWYARKGTTRSVYYAGRSAYVNGKRINVHLHRVIMETPEYMQVDHKDGNGLNCQRYNLRNVTQNQNLKNKRSYKNSVSIYKGVSPLRGRKYKLKNGEVRMAANAWQAQIQSDNKQIYLGYFNSETEAALAYNEAARRLHGEFASLNQIAA